MRVRLEVSGTVQGVGFRPQVYRLAQRFEVGGWVRNSSTGAVIEAEGAAVAVEGFTAELANMPPPARVTDIRRSTLPDVAAVDGTAGFRIAESLTATGAAGSNVGAPLAPDLRICERCLTELNDPENRRWNHPFISCTACGPRYSIAHSLPYDRARTSMQCFALCGCCRREFSDPRDRRFHAQPIACNECGPRLRLWDARGEDIGDSMPLSAALRALAAGQVLALLGIGGFQLLVDGSNERAVATLRDRKHRPEKPLAVLFSDLSQVRGTCAVSNEEAELLASAQGPIVLLDMLPAALEQHRLSGARGPNNSRLGAMLPTTGLHQLLSQRFARPLICTSGNRSGEPLCPTLSEALQRLAGIADLFLAHDRQVVRPVDDSVTQWVDGRFQSLRRARGWGAEVRARMPSSRQVLALGGHKKHSFTLTTGGKAFVSPHLGDLNSPLALERLEGQIQSWLELFAVEPEALVCDVHPGYGSTQLAERLAGDWGLPLLRVQHHHAHIAAVVAEYEVSEPVLGLAWDGAGLGSDGTLWGGEALLCDGNRWRRVGHFLPFQLPGGSRAMLEPRRSALGVLHRAGLWLEAAQGVEFTRAELGVIEQSLEREVNAPWTSSVGRLFDAAAALAGIRQRCSFEGQAAAEWMALAECGPPNCGAYPTQLDDAGVVDWRPLLSALLGDRRVGTPTATMARRFHQALADASLALAVRSGTPTIVLNGGCFQNRLLVELCRARLQGAGFRVLLARAVPPNDGGLSLGQAWLACHPDTDFHRSLHLASPTSTLEAPCA